MLQLDISCCMAVISAAASPCHATGGASEHQEGTTPAVTEGRAALATLNANGAQPPGQPEELDQTPSALQQWMYPGLFSSFLFVPLDLCMKHCPWETVDCYCQNTVLQAASHCGHEIQAPAQAPGP